MRTEAPRWTAKGLATRARILDAAAELMHEHGVARTAMPDVLKAAGVSNSQLYHYFSDKDDLTRAVVAHQIDAVVTINAAMLAELDSLAALEHWRDRVLAAASERALRNGCPLGSLASELVDTDETIREALADGFIRWQEVIRQGLGSLAEHGVLRSDVDLDALALSTLGAIQGGLLLSQTKRDVAPLRAALNGAIGYIGTFAA